MRKQKTIKQKEVLVLALKESSSPLLRMVYCVPGTMTVLTGTYTLASFRNE